MIVHPQAPGGYAIFCDDIRAEAGDKFSLMGVFGGEMFALGQAPVILPTFCVHVVYRDKPIPDVSKVTIVISKETENTNAENKEIVYQHDIDLPSLSEGEVLSTAEKDSIILLQASINVKLSPFILLEDCKLVVRVLRGDDEIRIGALKIYIKVPEESGKQ